MDMNVTTEQFNADYTEALAINADFDLAHKINSDPILVLAEIVKDELSRLTMDDLTKLANEINVKHRKHGRTDIIYQGKVVIEIGANNH